MQKNIKKDLSYVNRKHGKKYSPIYNIWNSMKMRCINKKNASYEWYGGRGISVCQEWLIFENFYKDMGDPEDGLSIDRIDNDKGYFKENCRWSTYKEQNNNRRTDKKLHFRNDYLNLFDLWKKYSKNNGVSFSCVARRIKKGIPLEIALFVKNIIGKNGVKEILEQNKKINELEERLSILERNICTSYKAQF